jgi:hypothetical protein
MQLGSALSAQPHQNAGGVDPVEGAYPAGYLHGIAALQALQSLHQKYSVIEFAFCPLVAVDAFPFQKELFFHGGQPLFSRRTARESIQTGNDLLVGC